MKSGSDSAKEKANVRKFTTEDLKWSFAKKLLRKKRIMIISEVAASTLALSTAILAMPVLFGEENRLPHTAYFAKTSGTFAGLALSCCTLIQGAEWLLIRNKIKRIAALPDEIIAKMLPEDIALLIKNYNSNKDASRIDDLVEQCRLVTESHFTTGI